MKNLFKLFLSGAAMAMGSSAGVSLFEKLKQPHVRANIKRKFINIKNAIAKNEEEEF